MTLKDNVNLKLQLKRLTFNQNPTDQSPKKFYRITLNKNFLLTFLVQQIFLPTNDQLTFSLKLSASATL